MKIIATLQLLLFLASCAPTKPTTNTEAPSIATSQQINRQVRENIVDSKDAIGRARRLNKVIDNKLNLLKNYR